MRLVDWQPEIACRSSRDGSPYPPASPRPRTWRAPPYRRRSVAPAPVARGTRVARMRAQPRQHGRRAPGRSAPRAAGPPTLPRSARPPGLLGAGNAVLGCPPPAGGVRHARPSAESRSTADPTVPADPCQPANKSSRRSRDQPLCTVSLFTAPPGTELPPTTLTEARSRAGRQGEGLCGPCCREAGQPGHPGRDSP
jgi:hypothetical protein